MLGPAVSAWAVKPGCVVVVGGVVDGGVGGGGGTSRRAAGRKSPPSQSNPPRRQKAPVGTSAAAERGVGPDRAFCNRVGGRPGRTPDAPSPSAARIFPPLARPSPPPKCLSPYVGETRGGTQGDRDYMIT